MSGSRREMTADMSEIIATHIETAARDAVASEGGMVTGFVALTTYIDSDGDRCWSMAASDEQGLAQSMGMAEILSMTVQAQVEAAFFGHTDDES